MLLRSKQFPEVEGAERLTTPGQLIKNITAASLFFSI